MRPRLLLVDGHALAYRAFYAIADLSNKAGSPTNAVFGFIRMLDQLRQQWAPSHAWIVFDGGLPADRLKLLDSYKAQREEMPSALRGQFSDIQEYLCYAGLSSLTVDGQEADDVIATLATQASKAKADVLIATSDKDLYQLVNEGTAIVSLTKSDKKMTAIEVEAKTGVSPDKIDQWLALIGDTADNIPGVPGVGPKTAAKLLNTFGSIENLYQCLDEVTSSKLRTALSDAQADVERNCSMTRLHRDLPLSVSWEDGKSRPVNVSDLLSFFQRMEFHSMARALENPVLFG